MMTLTDIRAEGQHYANYWQADVEVYESLDPRDVGHDDRFSCGVIGQHGGFSPDLWRLVETVRPNGPFVVPAGSVSLHPDA